MSPSSTLPVALWSASRAPPEAASAGDSDAAAADWDPACYGLASVSSPPPHAPPHAVSGRASTATGTATRTASSCAAKQLLIAAIPRSQQVGRPRCSAEMQRAFRPHSFTASTCHAVPPPLSADRDPVDPDTIGPRALTTCPDSSRSTRLRKELRCSETDRPTDTVIALDCIFVSRGFTVKRRSLPVAATLAATAALPSTARGGRNAESGDKAAEAD